MKGKILSFILCAFCAFSALAAVRTQNSPSRTPISETTNRTDANVATRVATNTRTISNRRITNTRLGTTRIARITQTATSPRGAITMAAIGRATTRKNTARATTARATATPTVQTNTFDENYHKCYEAYFSCMDQFCATVDDHYRRCICSSKLDGVQTRERALTQASNQLQDFKDLNIEVILKTPEEVKSMLSASEGEKKLSTTHDNSESSKKLTAIGDVLKKAKTNSLSTAGTLDIAGDIGQIWNTTDIVSGANIANLTGESLYNAVHSQCAELVLPTCPSMTTLNMVSSAYGMYIENDCSILLTALEKQSVTANAAVRETNREMNAARLENYNAHNSTVINDCIAGVRADITADTACGENYVHCLDLTGLYLNRITGEPIYTKNFYKLNDQISLSGNILTNSTNAKLVTELNSKRKFATHTLETCRDIADTVWDEYLRQAITEIYQGQQSKIQQVKNECMDVVNKCYDTKTSQLRDYSNIEEQMLLGSRLELSEEMCSEKLETCSNLYGGGPTGLALLVTEMHKIVDQKISQKCLATLQNYAQKLCRVSGNDISHQYPYGCRVYKPGDILNATNPECTYSAEIYYDGDEHTAPSSSGTSVDSLPTGYDCWGIREYSLCRTNYYLHQDNDGRNKCYVCPTDWYCPGGTEQPQKHNDNCSDYIGSLYQKMVQYALQYCVRPTEAQATNTIPIEVLADVNTVMDSIRSDMATILSKECTDLNGTWTDYTSAAEDKAYIDFYNKTNADYKWGVCINSTEGSESGEGE